MVSTVEEERKPSRPPGRPPKPPSGSIGHTTSFDSGSFELRIARAIVGDGSGNELIIDVEGGSFRWLAARAIVGSGLTVDVEGGLFGCRIADDVKTSSSGGTRRKLDVATAPFSILGAVGIIG